MGSSRSNIEDNKSGFVLCGRDVFSDLLDYRNKYAYWQLFIGVAAHAKGYSICQVETAFEPRRRGRSFLSDLPLMPMLWASAESGRRHPRVIGRTIDGK